LQDNIKIDLKEDGMDWVYLPQKSDTWRAVMSTVKNLRVP
jgi:hypothetical protein